MISAVLFDLDGTLLDIDLEPFLRDYFAILGPVVSDLIGNPSVPDALGAVIVSTEAMAGPHDGTTNREVFNATFREVTGVDLGEESAQRLLERFYAEQFPSLRNTHGPLEGAFEAVEAARSLGMKTVLATNPIFPLAAISERARWAGFDVGEFDLVTSYENAEACKPLPAYFKWIASEIGVPASECIMVGDDPSLDLAAADVGMKTFFAGTVPRVVSDWSGTLGDLALLLPRLV